LEDNARGVCEKGVTGREHNDKAHLLIDGIDGQVHYVEMAQAAASAVQIDRIVEINRPRRIERYVARLENRPPLAPDIAGDRGQGDKDDVQASTSRLERGYPDGGRGSMPRSVAVTLAERRLRRVCSR
jgi:hypothetical protein